VAFILPATACESRDLGVLGLGYRASALSAAAAAIIIAARALAARERSLVLFIN